VLESTYTSLAALVRAHGVPDFLVATRLDTLTALRSYQGPLLILHGERDMVIPVSHARAMSAAYPRARLVIQDCGHNDCPPQWELVLGFLAENGVLSASETGDSP
jgi:pimeloyl-ACP methyl ester carboxylesterase